MNRDQIWAEVIRARDELTAAQTRLANLEQQLNTPEPEPESSLLTKPVPGSGDELFQLYSGLSCTFSAKCSRANNPSSDVYSGGNIFQNEQLASAYAAAFNTMLLLRHQSGTEPSRDNHIQWFIRIDIQDHLRAHDINNYEKITEISPAFKTKAAAEAAIAAVGHGDIVNMFKTLHHIT